MRLKSQLNKIVGGRSKLRIGKSCFVYGRWGDEAILKVEIDGGDVSAKKGERGCSFIFFFLTSLVMIATNLD